MQALSTIFRCPDLGKPLAILRTLEEEPVVSSDVRLTAVTFLRPLARVLSERRSPDAPR
jgi:hypothetical protein